MVSLHHFNPRSREGSDVVFHTLIITTFQFQSTLPLRERHILIYSSRGKHHISIHAPVKGATRLSTYVLLALVISIHAPVKGATSVWDLITQTFQFQSTLP